MGKLVLKDTVQLAKVNQLLLGLMNFSCPVGSCLFRLLGAVVVIAANAGGAWTPIGDVTTTMLWIHGQVTTLNIIKVGSTFLLRFHFRSSI
jgi:Na+/H+ antiporter NhaD/arsenite permease-like protein